MKKHIVLYDRLTFIDKLIPRDQFHLTLLINEKFHKKSDFENFHNVYILKDNVDLKEVYYLLKSIHDERKIDFFNCYNERSQLNYSKIHDLFFGTNLNFTISCFCDKKFMRNVLYKNNINNVKFHDLLEENCFLNFPIVIKPKNGSASKDINIVNSNEEYKKISSLKIDKSEFLVEEFIRGIEYSVETISQNGVHQIVSITEKKTHKETSVEIAHYVPSPRFIKDEVFSKKIETFIFSILDTFKYMNGFAHSEIILNSNDQCYLVESQARICGDHISDLIYESFDFNCEQFIVDNSLNKYFEYNLRFNGKYSYINFLYTLEHGIIKYISFNGYDNYRFLLLKDKGEKINGLKDSFSRLAFVINHSYDFEEGKNVGENLLLDFAYKIETDKK